MKLTPDDIARLQAKELATTSERALIAQASVGSDAQAAGGFAGNWDELAQRLGVSRRSIQTWRDDPRYAADCPTDRADGRKDVTAWAEFMVRHGLKRADEFTGDPGAENEDSGIQFPAGTEAQWKKKLLEQKVAQAEIETGQAGIGIGVGAVIAHLPE